MDGTRRPDTLVVFVHPLEQSYTGSVLEAVIDGLETAGRPHRVVRLAQGEAVPDDALAVTAHLIVVAPTWWGAMPAHLLAWIQDRLGPWIDGTPDAPSPLATVRRLTVVTSHGSSQLINRVQGEPGRHLWRRAVLPLCAPGAEFDWVALYKIDRLDEAARVAFIERVRGEIATLSRATAPALG